MERLERSVLAVDGASVLIVGLILANGEQQHTMECTLVNIRLGRAVGAAHPHHP